MKILMIGGTKFIGKRISEFVVRDGHDIVYLNRGLTSPKESHQQIIADVESLIEHKEKILSHDFDIAIHCIAFTEKHALDIVEVFQGTRTKIIILSSCDCYEAFQGLNRCIDKAELPIRENSKLSDMKYYWSDSKTKGSWAKEYDKNLLTDILIKSFNENEINLTIFRLPMVYGPGDYQYKGRHGYMIRRILDNRKSIILSDREQCQVYTYGYIDNVASAIVHSFDKDICNGKVYNIGEESSRSRRKWTEMYASAFEHNFEFHIIPEELIRKDSIFRSAPPQHLLVDNSLYCRETGFEKPVSINDAIKRTFNYAKENPECLGENPNYDKEDALIRLYESHLNQIQNNLKESQY